MINIRLASVRPALLAAGLLAIAAASVMDSPAPAQSRGGGEDARTCAGFGLDYGTRGHSACVRELQRRADFTGLSSLEEMALTSQIARDGQIMAERARRQRCDRDPDRRECLRR